MSLPLDEDRTTVPHGRWRRCASGRRNLQDHDDFEWSIGGWSGITDDGEAAERAAFNEKAEQTRIESGVLWRAELEALGPGKVMTREELEIEPADLTIPPGDLTIEDPFKDNPDPWGY